MQSSFTVIRSQARFATSQLRDAMACIYGKYMQSKQWVLSFEDNPLYIIWRPLKVKDMLSLKRRLKVDVVSTFKYLEGCQHIRGVRLVWFGFRRWNFMVCLDVRLDPHSKITFLPSFRTLSLTVFSPIQGHYT